MEEQVVDRIFAGFLTGLPAVRSKIVRIFTSSTFTDMLMERNTLMEYVYPKIKEYCRERHGLEFQVILYFSFYQFKSQITSTNPSVQTNPSVFTLLIGCRYALGSKR